MAMLKSELKAGNEMDGEEERGLETHLINDRHGT
jgi:hypothetical protein